MKYMILYLNFEINIQENDIYELTQHTWSISRAKPGYKATHGKLGYPYIRQSYGKPYLVTNIYQKTISLQAFIWELHNGPIPFGYEVDHIDEDIHNYDINNLQILPKYNHKQKHKQSRKNLRLFD